MSRGQSRSTALSGSGEGRGARIAGLTAQPERGQVNRSVWAREATPGHCSKLGGRSGRRTRDINKATREKASGHPHRATPPPPQQPWSRPGPREPPAHPAPPPTPPDAVPNPGLQPPRGPARSSPRPATGPDSSAPCSGRGPARHRRGPCTAPPPAVAAFAPTWPACPPSPGHCAHVRGRGHNPARIPPPGKGAHRAARSQSAREPAS